MLTMRGLRSRRTRRRRRPGRLGSPLDAPISVSTRLARTWSRGTLKRSASAASLMVTASQSNGLYALDAMRRWGEDDADAAIEAIEKELAS